MAVPTIGIQWPIDELPENVTFTAEQQAEIVNLLFGFGRDRANRGVMRGVLNECVVTQSDTPAKSIKVETGVALADGRLVYVSVAGDVTIGNNTSGQPRLDYVVLQYKLADYPTVASVVVVPGTPAASPSLPTLVQMTGLYQIPLAYVTVASGFTTITNANILNDREWLNVPDSIFMEVTNSSAAVNIYGEVGIWDTGAGGRNVNSTTTEADAKAAGIWERRTAVSGTGRIIVRGITEVLCDESVAVGDLLETSTTAGQAQKVTRASRPAWGRVLTANSGAGTRCLAYVDFRHTHGEQMDDFVEVRMNAASQIVNSVSATKLNLDTDVKDTYSEWDTTNKRWTPRTGQYIVSVQIVEAAAPGFAGNVWLYKNGAAYRGLNGMNAGTPVISGVYTTVIEQTVGSDYYEVFVSGGTFMGGSGDITCRFMAIRR